MIITTKELSDLILIIFFIYIYFELRIYLAAWAALFYLLRVALGYLFNSSGVTQKTIILAYLILVLASYLYKFRSVFVLEDKREEIVNYPKLKELSADKSKQRRVGIAVLLLIFINIVIVLLH